MADERTPGQGLTKREIESHSSGLFNKRIDEIIRYVNNAELEANNAMPPSIQHAIAYHSSLMTLWQETNQAYKDDKSINDKVTRCVDMGEKCANYLKRDATSEKPTATMYDVVWLIQNCKMLRFQIYQGLHNLKYFFRIGQRDPKGILETLALFKQSDWKEKKDGK